MNRKEYQQTLPRKRIAAGCLFFDEAGQLLLVKPTYKEGWDIPGGVVEANESPLAGCVREIREELGIEWLPQRLLAVDFNPETPEHSESLHFIFYGGVLPPEIIAAIRLPARELSEFVLLEPAEAVSRLKPRLRRRVYACLPLLQSPGMVYLEEGKPVWPEVDSGA